MPKLRLTLTATQFVTDDDDLDAPAPTRALVVDRQVFDAAVSFASAHGFRKAGRQLFCRYLGRGQVSAFARCVRLALAAKPEVAGVRASSRMTADNSLRSFFAVPAHNRELRRILSFVELGGELTAEEV